MQKYIIRRLLLAIPTILIVISMVFLAVRALPGDFVTTKLASLEAQGSETRLNAIHGETLIEPTTHRVLQGQTLQLIADLRGVSLDRLRALNDLGLDLGPDFTPRAGDRLVYIPGQPLHRLASVNKVTVEQLIALNQDRFPDLVDGDSIIPGGETAIIRLNVTIAELAEVNRIEPSDIINVNPSTGAIVGSTTVRVFTNPGGTLAADSLLNPARIHPVVAGETFGSIVEAEAIGLVDLFQLNPELRRGLEVSEAALTRITEAEAGLTETAQGLVVFAAVVEAEGRLADAEAAEQRLIDEQSTPLAISEAGAKIDRARANLVEAEAAAAAAPQPEGAAQAAFAAAEDELDGALIAAYGGLIPEPGLRLAVTAADRIIMPTTKITEAAIRHRLRVDRPLWKQYITYIWDTVRLDFGTSFQTNKGALEEIAQVLPRTVQLGIFTLIIAMAVSIPVGVISAIRQDSMPDYSLRSFAILALAAPVFWTATMMIFLVTRGGLFGGGLWEIPFTDPAALSIWESPGGFFKLYTIPAVAGGLSAGAGLMRITRSSLLEVLRQDYLRTAAAKGLRERTIILRHGLRNAMIPVLSVFGLQLAALAGGTVILEFLFGIPGMGQFLVLRLIQQDIPPIQTVVLLFAVFTIAVNLLIDLSYAVVDPRIRYG